MPMDLVFVLKWVKSVIGCTFYIFHLSGSFTAWLTSCLTEYNSFALLTFYIHSSNRFIYLVKSLQSSIQWYLPLQSRWVVTKLFTREQQLELDNLVNKLSWLSFDIREGQPLPNGIYIFCHLFWMHIDKVILWIKFSYFLDLHVWAKPVLLIFGPWTKSCLMVTDLYASSRSWNWFCNQISSSRVYSMKMYFRCTLFPRLETTISLKSTLLVKKMAIFVSAAFKSLRLNRISESMRQVSNRRLLRMIRLLKSFSSLSRMSCDEYHKTFFAIAEWEIEVVSLFITSQDITTT